VPPSWAKKRGPKTPVPALFGKFFAEAWREPGPNLAVVSKLAWEISTMLDAMVLKRRRAPEDPGAGAVLFFSLIAAAGFAFGWMTQSLGAF
jgi:hypothetical protein